MSARVFHHLVCALIAQAALAHGSAAFAQPNHALHFSKDNDVVLVADSASLDVTGPITVEAWVKPDPAVMQKPWNFIVSKNMSGTGYALLMYGTSSKQYVFEGNLLHQNTSVSAQAPAPMTRWTHVAGVWRRGNGQGVAEIYVDGRLVSSLTTADTPPVPNTEPLQIGSSPFTDGVHFPLDFRGDIDEVRIWRRARTAAEIVADMRRRLVGTEPDLVAYWPFDEGAGAVAGDASGHGNTGQVRGAAWVPSESPTACDFCVQSVDPTSAGNDGLVTVTLTGANLAPTNAVALTRGSDAIPGRVVSTAPGGASQVVQFDLAGATTGTWSLAVTGTRSVELRDAFTITDGGAPDVWIAKTGSTAVPGRTLTYYITVGNRGASDVENFVVSEMLEPWFTFVEADPAPDAPPAAVAGTSRLVAWTIPVLKPGEMRVVRYRARLDPQLPVGLHVTGGACITRQDFLACRQQAEICYHNNLLTCGGNELLLNWAWAWQAFAFCLAELNVRCATSEVACYALHGDILATRSRVCAADEQDTVAPVDPNEKLVVPHGYARSDQRLLYPIHFENLGSAEAADVFVTDVLDGNLDLSTIKILSGGATLDEMSRTLQWNLTGRNLPPGQGDAVLFSIKPVPGLPSGTRIRNRARIQFEVFAPLTTADATVVIDDIPPTATVSALPAESSTLRIPVNWSGADEVGEIDTYSVFVATNGGPFVPLLPDTRATSTVFEAATNTSYQFAVTARDKAGNEEVGPLVAEAATVVRDGDGDGLPDTWEAQYGLDPTSAAGVDGADGDPDRDARSNLDELRDGTDPRQCQLFFAEGANGLGLTFGTRIALFNPQADVAANVVVEYLDPSGLLRADLHRLDPGQRITLDTRQYPELARAEFSTAIRSNVGVVADRTMSWGTDAYGAHAERAVGAPSRTWYFAEGATTASFNLFYLLQNPSQSPARVGIRYLLPKGPPLHKEYALEPSSRTNIWVNQEVFGNAGVALASTEVSAVIEVIEGDAIIAERAMYLDSDGRLFDAGHESTGIMTPAIEWFLAEGATGPFFDLFVLVANPGVSAAEVEATYMLPNGSTVTKPYTVPANARFTIWVNHEDARLANTAVSTILRSINGAPIIVERAMWWPGSPSHWYEAHNSAGARTTATAWALAEGEVDVSRHLETYILVANTSDRPGDVEARLHFEDGSRAERTFTIPGRSRFNISVADMFPEAAGKRFAAVIESVGGTPVAIVVERAMYWDSAGQRWAAGTNALATKVR